jgi:hypothetical protein
LVSEFKKTGEVIDYINELSIADEKSKSLNSKLKEQVFN